MSLPKAVMQCFKYLVPLLDSGWPRPTVPSVPWSCTAPFPPLSWQSSHGIVHPTTWGKWYSKKKSSAPLASSVSVWISFSLQHSWRRVLLLKRVVSHWERHVRVGLAEPQSELPASVPHCVDILRWFFFNCYIEHLVMKMKSWQVYRENK